MAIRSLFMSKFFPIQNQWAFISTLHKMIPEELAEYLSKLCAGGDMGVMLESTTQKPWSSKQKPKELSRKDFLVQARLKILNLLYVDKVGFSQKVLSVIKRLAPSARIPNFIICKVQIDRQAADLGNPQPGF